MSVRVVTTFLISQPSVHNVYRNQEHWTLFGLYIPLSGINFRSSHRRCSVKLDVLKNFENFTGKNPVLESLLYKVAGLRSATLLKSLQHSCFPVKFSKFLRTLILTDIC